MPFKPTSQTLPLSILQETAELVVPVPSFAETTNQQPAWLFGNGFKINSKVGGSPTEGWSKRGQCRQVEIAEVYYTLFQACQPVLTFLSSFLSHTVTSGGKHALMFFSWRRQKGKQLTAGVHREYLDRQVDDQMFWDDQGCWSNEAKDHCESDEIWKMK